MKKPNPAPERPPLASPFELAQIAVALAMLHGMSEPDIESAIILLRKSAFRVQEEKRPRAYFPDSVMAKTIEEAEAMKVHSNQVAMSPKTHPQEFADLINLLKSFIKGSDRITPPKRYPATNAGCWRAVLGRWISKRELQLLELRIAKSAPLIADYISPLSLDNEREFWEWASRVIPHLPRFLDCYQQTQKKRKRSKGKFTKEVRDEDGHFKKKSDS